MHYDRSKSALPSQNHIHCAAGAVLRGSQGVTPSLSQRSGHWPPKVEEVLEPPLLCR